MHEYSPNCTPHCTHMFVGGCSWSHTEHFTTLFVRVRRRERCAKEDGERRVDAACGGGRWRAVAWVREGRELVRSGRSGAGVPLPHLYRRPMHALWAHAIEPALHRVVANVAREELTWELP